MNSSVKVAILGMGTVGGGVAEVLAKNSAYVAKSAGMPVELKYILDVRDFPGSPYEDKLIKDFAILENDPEVKIVAETIGGAKIAYEFTKRALMAGKSVVTSNKELVATHGCELLEIAREHNCNYLFEASVGGGIPILRPLELCLAGNELTEVYGILNGTTNYILTKMITESLPFETALEQAQQNGYAERNPSADIEGVDAARKICILGAMAFGRCIDPGLVPAEGISGVTVADHKYAARAQYKIKLIGRVVKLTDGRLCPMVAPMLVPSTNLVSSVDDVINVIAVRGNAIGEALFVGPGAGSLPTASAVVGDIIDCARHLEKRKDIEWLDGDEEFFHDASLLPFRWYVRGAEPVDGAEELASVESDGENVFITPPMTRAELDAALKTAPSGAFRILD